MIWITGGCLCGALRYEATAPEAVRNLPSWVTVPPELVRFEGLPP